MNLNTSFNKNKKTKFFKEEKYFINFNIRSQKVRCIDPDGNNAVLSIKDAVSLADTFGLDLVQISNGKEEIPTCKILDYSKFKYEQSKKEKLSKKKQRENVIKVKEIKFRPSTDLNDLKIKAKHAQDFLDEGHKLKVTVVFRGRELQYQQVAAETMTTFVSFLKQCVYESNPVTSGKFMTAVIKKAQDKPQEDVKE